MPQQIGEQEVKGVKPVQLCLVMVTIVICVRVAQTAIKPHKLAVEANVPGLFTVSDLWVTLLTAVMFQVSRYLIMATAIPIYDGLCKEKSDPVKKERLIYKAAKCTNQLVYFTFSTIYGWYTLSSLGWIPYALGGTGSIKDQTQQSLSGAPFDPQPASAKLFSLVTWGYHLGELIWLLLKKQESDFVEMLLHHIVTNSLYTGFMFSNYMQIGTTIAYLHDVADVPVNMCRVFLITKYDNVTTSLYVVLMIAFIWTRMVVFPQIIYWIYQTWLTTSSPAADAMIGLNFLLIFMQILHAYWTVLLAGVGFHRATTGKVEDLINQVDGKKEK